MKSSSELTSFTPSSLSAVFQSSFFQLFDSQNKQIIELKKQNNNYIFSLYIKIEGLSFPGQFNGSVCIGKVKLCTQDD